MIKTIVIDMDGTLIDFTQGNLQRALKSMSNPEYYKGLPLLSDCRTQLQELDNMGITLRILSGVADPVQASKYISHVDYNQYYARVCEIKFDEIVRLFGDENVFESVDFIKQSDSKAEVFQSLYGSDELKEAILIDDYHRYCKEWVDLGGVSYQIGKDFKNLTETLDYIINQFEKGDY